MIVESEWSSMTASSATGEMGVGVVWSEEESKGKLTT